jgi:hypothetical protein
MGYKYFLRLNALPITVLRRRVFRFSLSTLLYIWQKQTSGK